MSVTPKILAQARTVPEVISNYIAQTQGNTTIRTIALSENKILALYQFNNVTYARVGIMGENDIVALGAPVIVYSNDIRNTTLTALSESTAVVLMADTSNNTYPTCIALSINGTDIIVGNKYVANSNTGATNNYSLSIERLTPSTFAACYYVTVSGVKKTFARIGTVSGTTISFGAEVEITSSGILRIDLVALNSTSVMFGYSGTTYVGCKVATISGTTMTLGEGLSITISSLSAFVKIIPLRNTPNKALLVYTEGASSSYCYANVLTYVNRTVTLGSVTNSIFGVNYNTEAPSFIGENNDGTVTFYGRGSSSSNLSKCEVFSVVDDTLVSIKEKMYSFLFLQCLKITDSKMLFIRPVGISSIYYVRPLLVQYADNMPKFANAICPNYIDGIVLKGESGKIIEITRIDVFSESTNASAETLYMFVNDLPIKAVASFSSVSSDGNKETFSLEMAQCPIILNAGDKLEFGAKNDITYSCITIYGIEEDIEE
jgi:hypothetical protein